MDFLAEVVGDAEPAAVTQEHLNEFLAFKVHEYASRVAKGLPIERCEVQTGGVFVGDPPDLRCRRFTNRTWESHGVCGYHEKSLKLGKQLSFVGQTAVPHPRAYVIWARDADELMARARELAIP